MTFETPLALGALVVLPLIWFWHRRRNRPRPVDLPSLLFFREEADVPPARRQALDLDLWLALGAAVLAILGAWGPRWLVTPGGRTVRVVVSEGAPGEARGYADRVRQALAGLEDVLGRGDELVRVAEPAEAPQARRPRQGALLAAARSGEATWRAVVTDAAPPDSDPGVHWCAIGDPDALNVGLVAATLRPQGAGVLVFGNVQGDATRDTRVSLALDPGLGGEPTVVSLDLAAGGYASHAFGLPRVGSVVTLEIRDAAGVAAWSDDLPLDDRVTWERRPLNVAWADDLPADLRVLVESALHASLGQDGYGSGIGPVDLRVGRGDPVGETTEAPDAWTLLLHPAPADASGAPFGSDRYREDGLVQDLSTTGVDLRYGPGADRPPDDITPLLWRQTRGRAWPVVARSGREVHFLPDPRRGGPPPSRSPLWPLFVDNLVRLVLGDAAGGDLGYRRTGLLDRASSRLGTIERPLDIGTLALAPADRAPVWRSGRPWLAGAALACLLVLWLRPRPARRTRPVSGRRAAPSSVPSPS